MSERSLEETMENAQRDCNETHIAAAQAREASRDSLHLLGRTGEAKIVKRSDETWEDFIDRFAEAVLQDLPREFPDE